MRTSLQSIATKARQEIVLKEAEASNTKEPIALIGHDGIRAGAVGQPAVLPRPMSMYIS